MAKSKKIKKSTHSKTKVLRFAHPFFTDIPPSARPKIPGVGKRMLDFIAPNLLPFPDPQREPVMLLEEVIGKAGVQEIVNAGSIVFHAVGDTGHENGQMQEFVANAMTLDYDINHPETSPAFLLHLGDVIYYDNTDKGYQAQFYVPYKRYPGKILAIPGNHDGEIFKFDGTPSGQKTSLAAFWRNFCQTKPGVPPDAGTIYREMVSQPGAYWHLEAPFIDIIALYSNIGEGPGFISVATSGGFKQTDWLTSTLIDIKSKRGKGDRKALIIVVHHPPFSEGGHSSSVDMLKDIDTSCNSAGIYPDAVLAAHSHNYQRFTRLLSVAGKKYQTPYYVVGTGGRGTGQVKKATGALEGDHSFDASYLGYGYLKVMASSKQLSFSFTQVDLTGAKKSFDKKVTVDLATNTIL